MMAGINLKSASQKYIPIFSEHWKQSGITITEAETRVLVLMTLKLNGNEMAKTLGISPQSVRDCKMRLKKNCSLTTMNQLKTI